MKILNLYAGIGGNRSLWGNDHTITAVEINQDIAAVYKDLYPADNVIIGDAHEFLEKNYMNYDFIWSSPPCQSHSIIRYGMGYRNGRSQAVMPDMNLYSEIVFLKHYFKGLWVVENVKPFYNPLIPADVILDRHLFWCNFGIKLANFKKDIPHRQGNISNLCKALGIDILEYQIKNKRQILRNCVLPGLGLYILNQAIGIKETKTKQAELFN